jgi:hypothetical protein
MGKCKKCGKKYKQEKWLNKHQKKCKVTPPFNFAALPLDIQFKILHYLYPIHLRKVLRAYPKLFSKKYNLRWSRKTCKILKRLPRKIKPENFATFYLKYKNNLCINCWKFTSCLHHFYHIPICRRCTQNTNLGTISKSAAKYEYKLQNSDLAKIPSKITPNIFYGKDKMMTIYMIKDIERLITSRK